MRRVAILGFIAGLSAGCGADAPSAQPPKPVLAPEVATATPAAPTSRRPVVPEVHPLELAADAQDPTAALQRALDRLVEFESYHATHYDCELPGPPSKGPSAIVAVRDDGLVHVYFGQDLLGRSAAPRTGDRLVVYQEWLPVAALTLVGRDDVAFGWLASFDAPPKAELNVGDTFRQLDATGRPILGVFDAQRIERARLRRDRRR